MATKGSKITSPQEETLTKVPPVKRQSSDLEAGNERISYTPGKGSNVDSPADVEFDR